MRPKLEMFPFVLLIMLFFSTSCKQNKDLLVIGYVQITPDPILDVAKASLFEALKDSGYIDGQNIKILDNNAHGDISMITTILQSYVSQGVDVIVTNSTPCMMAAAQMVKDIPVVFTVSFGPDQIGLKEVPQNLYGVYDSLKVTETVDLIQRCIPAVKKVGMPINDAEPNSVYSSRVMTEEFSKRGIEVTSSPVNSPNDILLVGEALCQKDIDAIVVAAVNIVYLGLNALSKSADNARIPLIVTDPMHVNKGASLGYGVNYNKWGYMSGQKVIDILKGRGGTGDNIIPITDYDLIINKTACQVQGLAIPEEVKAAAVKVIE